MAKRFGQQEVPSWFITVYKPVYIAFINLAVAFDAPTHQDIICIFIPLYSFMFCVFFYRKLIQCVILCCNVFQDYFLAFYCSYKLFYILCVSATNLAINLS